MITYYKGEKTLKAEFNHVFNLVDGILNYMEEPVEDYAVIAGGCILDLIDSTYPNDVDVFFKDRASFEAAGIRVASQGYNRTFQSDGHEIWEPNSPQYYHFSLYRYDLVATFYDSPEAVINSFDFTICRAAVTREFMIFDEDYFEDNMLRKLVIKNLDNPLSTLRRVARYCQAGYSIEDRELEKLARALSNLDMDNPKDNFWLEVEPGKTDLKARETIPHIFYLGNKTGVSKKFALLKKAKPKAAPIARAGY